MMDEAYLKMRGGEEVKRDKCMWNRLQEGVKIRPKTTLPHCIGGGEGEEAHGTGTHRDH